MKAWIAPPIRPIPPFGETADALPVLGQPLRKVQEQALFDAGMEVVPLPPTDEPWLRVGGATWFTWRLVRRFLKVAQDAEHKEATTAHGAQLLLVHEDFQRFTEPLQGLPGPGLHDLAIIPTGGSPDLEPPPLVIAPDLAPIDMPEIHSALADRVGFRQIPVGLEMIHRVEHWSHLLRVNLLALVHLGAEEKKRFEEARLFLRILYLLGILFRARSLNPWRLARALTQQGPNCRIHPTATVEVSRLGRDVEIGPYAVVRGSMIGDGAHIEEFATVNLAVVGAKARVGRYGMCNLSVLMENAFVSAGGGWQACVFGRDSFVAMTATAYDLCFHGEVKVDHLGERVSSGGSFLGAAIGHRARVGAGVVLGYGMEIPNDGVVVRDPEDILRRWPPGEGIVKN